MQSASLKEAGTKSSNSLEEETTLIGLTFGGYLRSKVTMSFINYFKSSLSKTQEASNFLSYCGFWIVDKVHEMWWKIIATWADDGSHCWNWRWYRNSWRSLHALKSEVLDSEKSTNAAGLFKISHLILPYNFLFIYLLTF